ncbi:MAG: double zinc ribbon domain-containing protein [Candidatus Acidiferrales bacterium]
MILKGALDAPGSVLFPGPCRICGRTLTRASRIPICETCLTAFERIAEPMCLCHGRPFASAVAGQAIQPRCRLCRVNFYAFDRVRSFVVYDDTLSEAIREGLQSSRS